LIWRSINGPRLYAVQSAGFGRAKRRQSDYPEATDIAKERICKIRCYHFGVFLRWPSNHWNVISEQFEQSAQEEGVEQDQRQPFPPSDLSILCDEEV
jgi:hypothetical protein